jgi:sarcosine oxidase subunit gamma
MSDPVTSESPLARFDLATRSTEARGDAGIRVRERALLGHLNLRGGAADPRFVAGVEAAVGVAPPVVSNTVREAQGHAVYWLGPGEWLLVTAGERRSALERELRAALDGVHAAITDVSGGQTVVVLRGARVRELLAKGCPLDLHPRAFDVGQCAQSHLAKAPILIRLLDREPAFEIVVRRSFADYLWLWMEDAAGEYGWVVDG